MADLPKNNGVPTNQLSNLDGFQVLKDSHNLDNHAIDVNDISKLIPTKYNRLHKTYDNDCRLSQVTAYGRGTNEVYEIVTRANVLGKQEIVSANFLGQTGSSLNGKYIKLFDKILGVEKSYLAWFNTGSAIQPAESSDYYIEVTVNSGDTYTALITAFKSSVEANSDLSVTQYTALALITASYTGPISDATTDTSIMLTIAQQGVLPLDGTLFYIHLKDTSDKYAFYFRVDGANNPPAHSGISLTSISILSTYNDTQIAVAIYNVIVQLKEFRVSQAGNQLIIQNRYNGPSNGFVDSNTGFTTAHTQIGTVDVPVYYITLEYDSEDNVIDVTRI